MTRQGPAGVAPDFGVRIPSGHEAQPGGSAGVGRLEAEHVRRRPPHSDARVARGQLEQQRHGVDGQGRRLARLAADAVQGVPPDAGHGILQEPDEAGDAPLVGVVVEQGGAPLAHLRMGVGEAGHEGVERRRARLIQLRVSGLPSLRRSQLLHGVAEGHPAAVLFCCYRAGHHLLPSAPLRDSTPIRNNPIRHTMS
jgi:hypothetical protein